MFNKKHKPMSVEKAMKQIDKALREDECKLHGFSSGGGLRVLRLETKKEKLVGYGEHPSADEALRHLGEDYEAGCRNYSDVYGKLYDAYWTGSTTVTSPLDAWLRRGSTIDALLQPDGTIKVELLGYCHNDLPKAVQDLVLEGRGPLTWSNSRGHHFRTTASHFPGNGEPCTITETVSSEDWAIGDPTFYRTTRTGVGDTFTAALAWAMIQPDLPANEPNPRAKKNKEETTAP